MRNIWRVLFVISQIFVYILSIIIVIQILKLIFGGSWRVEDVILALLVANITLTFGVLTKVMIVDKRLHGHLEWHRGKGS